MGSTLRPVGFLVRGLEPSDTYNRKAWTAVYDLAVERGCDLFMVSGQVLDDPNPMDRAHAAVFRLLSRRLIDGGLLSPTVTNRTTSQRLEQFDRELGDLCIVATSVRVGSRPLLKVDNNPGIEAIVRHLIQVHGCRSIVHVRGPYPNEESAEREAGWRSELTKAGITIRPEWLVPGSFDFEGLETIGQDIVERAGRDIDAVVCCNDVAAHRVMEDFAAMGIRVPEDVRVCGFDDIEKSQHSAPSLTTVRQPVSELTRLAWGVMDDLIAGRHPGDRSVPAALVVRASCGCDRDHWGPDPFPQLSGMPEDETLDLMTHYEQRMETFQGAVYDLHNFIRAMNRVTEVEQLAPILHEWLPRLGVARFAILRTSDDGGDPVEHVCRWNEDELLPTAPDYFTVLTANPPLEEGPRTIPGAEFSMPGWFGKTSPFVFGLFPLVTGDTWYGLAIFELTRNAGLLELILQEQLASAFDRIVREKLFRETEALRRFAAEVAHEINTPLGALVSAHGTIETQLTMLADEWMRFALSLSDEGRRLFSRIYQTLSSTREFPSPAEARQNRRRWAEVLQGMPEAEKVAEDLALLGFQRSDSELKHLSQAPDFGRVVSFLAHLADLPKSTAIVGLAAEKIGNYVRALRKSLI